MVTNELRYGSYAPVHESLSIFFHVRFVSCAMKWDRAARLFVDVDWDVIRFQLARHCPPLPAARGNNLLPAYKTLPLNPPGKLQVCFISDVPSNTRMGVGIVFTLSLREHPKL